MSKSSEIVSYSILNYLKKNPNAGDTLEGIADWWLENERVASSLQEIRQVLDMLVKNGKLRVIRNSYGVTIYKINK